MHVLRNCSPMNATETHQCKYNIGSGNGFVPSGNKPLPVPMMNLLCHHMILPGYNEFNYTTTSYSIITCSRYWILMHKALSRQNSFQSNHMDSSPQPWWNSRNIVVYSIYTTHATFTLLVVDGAICMAPVHLC